jgi:hypothetical protein
MGHWVPLPVITLCPKLSFVIRSRECLGKTSLLFCIRQKPSSFFIQEDYNVLISWNRSKPNPKQEDSNMQHHYPAPPLSTLKRLTVKVTLAAALLSSAFTGIAAAEDKQVPTPAAGSPPPTLLTSPAPMLKRKL